MTFMKEEKLGEMLGIGVGSRVSITVQDAFIIFSDSGALKESQFQVQNSKVFFLQRSQDFGFGIFCFHMAEKAHYFNTEIIQVVTDKIKVNIYIKG